MKLTDKVALNDGETVEDLGDGFRIIQGSDEFRFGTDAVKLSDFAVLHSGDRVMDLCTGTGIIPILLHKKQPTVSVVGLEIQQQMAAMAQRSVKLNNLTEKIEIVQGDVKRIRDLYPAESFQVVTCNPPYMKNNTGKQNQKESITIARHELLCDLSDCVEAASYLLPSGGRFYMVHRPERLADIMAVMQKKNVEPKRLTLFAPAKGRPPRLLVVEGQKNRSSGLIMQIDTGEAL